MTEKEIQICKQSRLNTADFGSYSLNGYQTFINLLAKINKTDKEGKYLNPQDLQREYLLTAQEFSANFNTTIKNAYRALKEAVNQLLKTDIRIKENGRFFRINVCSKAEYIDNKAQIIIKFTDDIMPYLSQVREQFVLYNLKEVSKFKSIYSVRLYEKVQQFKDTGYIKTTAEDLRRFFGVGSKFKLYGDFKKYTFAYAVNEINRHYHIDLDFQEIKEGRKVVAIKFTFNKTKIAKRYKQNGTYTNEYIKPKTKTKYPDIVLNGQMSFEDKQQKQGQIGDAASKAIQNLQVN